MKLEEFLKLSKEGNLIPVYKEIEAGKETPISAFQKLEKSEYAFLLESVEGEEKTARYSFLGSKPSLVFESRGRSIKISYPHKKRARKFLTRVSPLDEIKKIMRGFKAVKVAGLPRFYGGLVGFMGYDMIRFFERLPDKNPDKIGVCDAVFLLAEDMLIFDHVRKTIKIVVNVNLPKRAAKERLEKVYSQAMQRIQLMQAGLLKREAAGCCCAGSFGRKPVFTSNFKKSGFKNAVRKAKDYIMRGDVIQVVLSQRFRAKISASPFQIYSKLRKLNPSPYMYFFKLGRFFIVGASPEMLVRCEDGFVQTMPIAGTRPRGKTLSEDKKLARQLLSDQKERAEHIMLVDLGRNDLGRVCLPGKVEIAKFMRIEKYSHVMHLVSEVRGRLDKARFDIYDVLKAAFPAGTVSGSPKIRAMEIIDELENLRRGPYAGCVGYFGYSGNMDTCITIRTIVIQEDTAYIQAGAGIVADSVPEREYKETVNKARALVEAIGG